MNVTDRKAIMITGAPGSGKDFLLKTVLGSSGLTEVALDKFIKAVHEGTDLVELKNHRSVIINGPAEHGEDILTSKKILEVMGYDTLMIYVYTSDEESKIRNDQRIKGGYKTINESVRVRKYNTCVQNMKSFSENFDKFHLFNNSNNFDKASEYDKKQITIWLNGLKEIVSEFLADDINEAFEQTFTEESKDPAHKWDEWKENLTSKEAMDQGHVTRAMLKTAGKNPDHRAYMWSAHEPTKIHVQPYDNSHVKTVAFQQGDFRIDYRMTRKGKYFSHHVTRLDKSDIRDYAPKGVWKTIKHASIDDLKEAEVIPTSSILPNTDKKRLRKTVSAKPPSSYGDQKIGVIPSTGLMTVRTEGKTLQAIRGKK